MPIVSRLCASGLVVTGVDAVGGGGDGDGDGERESHWACSWGCSIDYSFILWRWMGDVRIGKVRAARAPVVKAT